MASATNNSATAKRLRKEWANLQKSSSKKNATTTTNNKTGSSSFSTTTATSSLVMDAQGQDPDILLLPHEDNILQWMALLRGPDDTPYQGGVFQLHISCGTDYPLAPPTISFVTRLFHPNVHFRTGDVCLDILKKEWSPAWGIQAACRAILALLSDPDPTSPLNCDAGNMLRGGDVLCYMTTAHMYTVENAMFLAWPTTTTTNTAVTTTTATTTPATTTTTLVAALPSSTTTATKAAKAAAAAAATTKVEAEAADANKRIGKLKEG
jgi:peroxin-4